MPKLHLIGQEKYSSDIQMTLSNLILNEQIERSSKQLPHRTQEEVLLYSNSQPEALSQKYEEYSHIYFLNDAAKRIFEDHAVVVNYIGEIEEDELPKRASLLIRNTRFLD